MPTLVSLRGSLRTAVLRGAAALALVVALPGSALAAPGDLDTAFGSGGKVVVGNGFRADAEDVAVQAGTGKIVTVGSSQSSDFDAADFSVMRHNADGSPDTSFGGDGEVLTDFEFGEDIAQGVAIQSDGKIVVVGRHQETDDEFAGCCWFTVARYTTDGDLDTSFGGDGWISPGLAGGAEDAAGVAVLSDGKILAGARAGGDFALVRLLPNGTLDTTFDGDGVVDTSFFDEGGAIAKDMVVQPNGKIVMAGYSGEVYFDFAVARYNPDGSLDTTFGGDGKVTTDLGGYQWGETVAVQSTGKILVSGGTGEDFTLVRYNLDGTLDGGFGTGGVVRTDFGPPSAVNDLAVQSDDRIVAAGGAGTDFAVARYNADGTADTGFATGGRTTTDFGAFDRVGALALQSDGKIVAYGDTGDDRALARYLGGTGTPPPPPPPSGVDLQVTKTGPVTVSIGDRATYTITVTNKSSTASATGVTLTDTFTGPAGSVISATTTKGTCTTAVSCSLGTLAPAETVTVKVVAEPRATGTLTERASVTGGQSDPNAANNTATVTTTVNNARGCTRIGTSGNDTLTGTYGTDVICGLGGDDTINASYGTDTAYGDFGNDRVDGGFNDDTLYGGPGNDNVIGNYGNDRLNTVDSVSGNDTANGGMGTDTCTTDTGDTRVSCP
ncbi:calcium-binding protein [Streptomyces sp. RG80]|uniref:calcium-binding protein n=1 Tax=Streptomyces sp. RG80 TaxID=3157340 RepID=UPI0033902DB9